MDETSYSKVAIDKFMNEHILFKDAELKKYARRHGKTTRTRIHSCFLNAVLDTTKQLESPSLRN